MESWANAEECGQLSIDMFFLCWKRVCDQSSLVRKLMATKSSWQPHHQVVGKCKRSGTREFRFENVLGRQTLCFFSDKVAAAVAEGSLYVSVSAGAQLDRGSRRQKVHRTVARVRFHIKNVGTFHTSENWSKGMQALGRLDMTCRCSISVSNLPANSCFVVGPSCLCCNFRNQLLTSTYPMRDHMDIRFNLIKEAIWGRKFPPGDTLTSTSAWNSGYDTVLEPGLQSHDCPHTSNQQSKTSSA